MTKLSEVKSNSDVINYFKELPFYNKSIERSIKYLKNIDPLAELSFYEQMSIIKIDEVFKGYAMSYKVDIIEKNVQLYNLKQVN